jgi:signal transduction histidine kinase
VSEARDESEARERSREGLQRLADFLSDGIAVCKDGRILWANRRLCEISGRCLDALIGEAPESLLPRDAADFANELETRVARPDGGASAVRVVRVAGVGDRATAWVFRDIGRSGELEREVGQLGHALREANLEAESLRERVRRQRVNLDEVLTIVSHELRTPVTVVTGYARLLLSEKVGSLNEEQRGFVEESLKSCRRMNAFIANLLENSRDAGHDAPLQVHEASLEPTLEGVVSSFKPLFDEQGMVARLDLRPDTPAARFDPVRIEQVVSNLLANALKYSGPGGEITVATRPLQEDGRLWVEVSIADQGAGVPERERERIFERYVRVGEHSRAGGLGLGLAICRRAVEAHGGVIGVTDSDRGGARFWFTLPAVSEAASASLVGSEAESR